MAAISGRFQGISGPRQGLVERAQASWAPYRARVNRLHGLRQEGAIDHEDAFLRCVGGDDLPWRCLSDERRLGNPNDEDRRSAQAIMITRSGGLAGQNRTLRRTAMLTRRNLLRSATASVPVAAAGIIHWPTASWAQTGSKTFVLAHGSWHGGWCWNKVADRLRAKGHTFYTPSYTGMG